MLSFVAARIRASLSESAHYSRHNAPLIGLLGVIGFPLYYYIWSEQFPQPYESLPLRVLGMAICAPLVLYKRWPAALQRRFELYWIATLLYTLPFFFTFMLLKNQLTVVWSMSTMAALFLLVLALYDWLLVIAIGVIGSLLAMLAYSLTSDSLLSLELYIQQLPIYAFVLVAGSIFNYTAHMVKEERLAAHASIGRNIAHELRTPLLGMRGAVAALEVYIPKLTSAHRMAIEAGLDAEPIRARRLEDLGLAASRIAQEIDHSNTIIDMLLLSADQTTIKPDLFQVHSIKNTISQAFARYPFKSDREQAMVSWNEDMDFLYLGSDILVSHIIFNLTKNALHSLLSFGHGKIHVYLTLGTNTNKVSFMDTGPGIPPAQLGRIFDHFYTSKTVDQGTGLGLSFCKQAMQGMDGDIHCESKLGEYTLFELTFPRIS